MFFGCIIFLQSDLFSTTLTVQAAWKLALGGRANSSELVQSLPSRLVTAEELKAFSEAMKIYDVPSAVTVSNIGIKRKSGYLGGLDTQHYGRGKRAREVCFLYHKHLFA